MPISPQGRLHVVKNQDVRYLVNRSDLHLDCIEIADISIEYDKSIGPFRGTPFHKIEHVYEIQDLPPHSRVALPDRRKRPYPQLWGINTIEWRLGSGRDYLRGDKAYLEVEEMAPDETLEETVVEINVRYLRTESFDYKPRAVEGEYVKHVFLYRWNRDLYLVNNADVGAQRLRYKRKHSRPKLPARVQDEAKLPATFEIHDLPSGSFVRVVNGFDPNVESYSFNVKEVNWKNGKSYRGTYPLSITLLNYQSPYDSDLTSVERTPKLIEEEEQSEEPGNAPEESR